MLKKKVDRLGRPVKHGMYNTPEHCAWRQMKYRCTNPNAQRWDRYGARGITVCDRWMKSFIHFFEDLGPRPSREHSLERIDNNGNYEPGNVAWMTSEHQDNNKCTNVFLEFNGERLTIAQWSRKIGIEIRTLGIRLEAGWSIENALTTPSEPRDWKRSPGKRLLDAIKAKQIVELRAAGETLVSIAKRFGITQQCVWSVVHGRIWSHATGVANA